ncbi:MAG: hypothetical protein IPG71_14080 [bacterium]|nr:hypothetical protein [bacterium]
MITLFDLARAFAAGAIRPVRFHSLGLLWTAVSLASKEAGIACFTVPLLFAWLAPGAARRNSRGHFLLHSVLLFGLTVGYLYVRKFLSLPNTGDNAYYTIGVGWHVAANIGLALAALFSPVNTILVALGSQLWKVLAGSFVMGFLVFFSLGAREAVRTDRWRMILLLVMLTGIVQGPVFLMPHLTEANFTRSLAFGWLAFGLCASMVSQAYPGTALRRAFFVLMVLWFLLDLPAAYTKCREIAIDQARLDRFRTELAAYYESTNDSNLTIAVVDTVVPGYSVFRQPIRQELQFGEIPLGVAEVFHPRSMQSHLLTVGSADGARAEGADCLVHEDGRVEVLKQGWPNPPGP